MPSVFHARNGKNSATSRCQVVQREADMRAEAGCSELSGVGGGCFCKQGTKNEKIKWYKNQMRASDGDKAALKHPNCCCSRRSFPLIVSVYGLFIITVRRTLKRDAHTGRKLNPAVTDDIIELLNESRERGALQQDGIIQQDHSEGQRCTRVGGYCILTWQLHSSFFLKDQTNCDFSVQLQCVCQVAVREVNRQPVAAFSQRHSVQI